jgi:hypothetical protein
MDTGTYRTNPAPGDEGRRALPTGLAARRHRFRISPTAAALLLWLASLGEGGKRGRTKGKRAGSRQGLLPGAPTDPYVPN